MAIENIQAVHSDDIIALLSSLKILDAVSNGEYRCAICDETVTEANISCIYPEEDRIKLVCDKIDCADKLIARRSFSNE